MDIRSHCQPCQPWHDQLSMTTVISFMLSRWHVSASPMYPPLLLACRKRWAPWRTRVEIQVIHTTGIQKLGNGKQKHQKPWSFWGHHVWTYHAWTYHAWTYHVWTYHVRTSGLVHHHDKYTPTIPTRPANSNSAPSQAPLSHDPWPFAAAGSVAAW